MTELKFLYVLDVIEHERDWGQRPEGYMLFRDKESAEAWVKETYSNRGNSVPDCYDTYEGGRWEPVHETLYEKVKANGHGWVKSFSEVRKTTKTRKITLLWTVELDQDDFELTDDEIFNKHFEDCHEDITIK